MILLIARLRISTFLKRFITRQIKKNTSHKFGSITYGISINCNKRYNYFGKNKRNILSEGPADTTAPAKVA